MAPEHGSREAQHAAHPVVIIGFTLLAEELRSEPGAGNLASPLPPAAVT